MSSGKAWRSFSSSLQRSTGVPPLVRVDQKVYSALPIPTELLTLPKEMHDLGWESCRLVPVDKIGYMDLPPAEFRTLVNKIFPWIVNTHSHKEGSFSVVRESDGKIVCTHDGLSISGLRVFRGTTAHALFIDQERDITPRSTLALPSSTTLSTLQPSKEMLPGPVLVRCLQVNSKTVYQGHIIHSYTVADSGRTLVLFIWGPAEPVLTAGKLYNLRNIRLKTTTQRKDSLEMMYKPDSVEEVSEPNVPVEVANESPQQLSLRLDTKSLVASERCVWEEVKQHFGPGPYDDETQRKISRAVQGTPIVVSTNLRHATVRVVRFNVDPTTVQLDSSLRAFIPHMERGQPFAVLNDYTLVPLQALHCSFDPRMRTWQDITVASCSFVPARRVEVLSGFRTALEQGLAQWGLQLSKEPFVSKRLAILDSPIKERSQFPVAGGQSTPPRPTMPTSMVVCSVASDRVSQEDRDKNTTTAQTLSKFFKTPHVSQVGSEQDAVSFLDRTNVATRDSNSAMVIVTTDRTTRATRWLVTECLRRGVLPVCIPGVSAGKRQSLLCENTKVNIRTKFELNPLKGINVAKEVPSLASKNVLVVGIDTCHTSDLSVGAACGTLITPQNSSLITSFWKNEVRGTETEQVADQFGHIIRKAQERGAIDEVVLMQDGNVFSELHSMRRKVPIGCGFSFLCLHKRTNIRFLHKNNAGTANVLKGSVVQSLTPSPLTHQPLAPSFYLQSHDCVMSTARTVQFTVHSVSNTLDIADVQRLSFAMSHVFAPNSTKLPIPTRCAHKLAAIVERLTDAAPDFSSQLVPDHLGERLWFL